MISRAIVSTDSLEIAEVARRAGAEAPFVRPAELARDDTPMWPVVRHALATEDERSGEPFDYVLLLDPTSPARLPDDVEGAYERLRKHQDADGIVGVSRPPFSPIWHCVVERDGLMASLIEGGEHFGRRQEVPPVYRINGSLYLWRAGFVRSETGEWRRGRHLIYEIPEHRAGHGSLFRAHMHTPLWTSHPLPRAPLRTVDLFPAMTDWLGIPIPQAIDGEAVWLPRRNGG